MPFKSEAQRRLFWAAKGSSDVRRAHGFSRKTVNTMTKHDEGGKLPKVSKAAKKALRKRG
jgi:hypothetical protein